MQKWKIKDCSCICFQHYDKRAETLSGNWYFSRLFCLISSIILQYHHNIFIEKEKQESMKVMEKLKSLVKMTDFFYSTQMLRFDDDLQYKTITGGIVSIGIIVTIIVGFANMILDTLNLNTFTLSTEIIKNKVPTFASVSIKQQTPFRFAVQIWRQNVTGNKRFFDITFRHQIRNAGVVQSIVYIPLEPCTKSYFSQFPQLTDKFQNLQIGSWLCPPLNTTIDLSGKYSSNNYHQHVIQVSACNNDTDPSRPCASRQEIEEFFLSNQCFYFTFYFTNTQINPDKKDYKQYYIQDESYAIFGSKVGCETFLYFTDYTVQTDISIWPFSNTVTDKGVYAEDLGINHNFETNIDGIYIVWNLAKSTNSIVYTREVQKLSIVFSFMGGMIGAVSAVLFIIKIYTNVAFQFSIAFEIFKQRPQNSTVLNEKAQEGVTYKKLEQMSINFLSFVTFHIYQLLDVIGYKYNSPKLQYAKQCKDEIVNQLDVKKLLKRIIFIEHCLTNILDDYQLDALQLKKPQSPDYVRKIRLKCQSVVDHQCQGSNEQLLKSNQKQLKEQIVNKQNQTHAKDQQTPTIFLSYGQRQLTQTDKDKRFISNFARKNAEFQAKNEILVFDIDDQKMEKSSPFEPSSHIFGLSRNKKVGNSFNKQNERQKRRESNLIKLLNNAEQGDEISGRIWKKLDNEIRRNTIKCSKHDCAQ